MLQFKDIPKLGSVESPFYRQNLGMPNYPGYAPGLMHPGLTAGPTPFVPPNHLPTFQPKVSEMRLFFPFRFLIPCKCSPFTLVFLLNCVCLWLGGKKVQINSFSMCFLCLMPL